MDGFSLNGVGKGMDWTVRMLADILPGILAFVEIFDYLCGIIGRVTSGNTHNRFRFLVLIGREAK